MNPESPWSKRNLLAMGAIVLIAVVVIVITGIATSSGASTDVPATATQQSHPDFDEMLVDDGEISSIMDVAMNPTEEFDGLYPPWEQPYEPAECNIVGSVADSSEYLDAPWRFARTEAFEEDGGQGQFVGQAAVLFDTVDSAQGYFDGAQEKWDSCDGQYYEFPGTDGRWKMEEYSANGDILYTVSVVEDETGDWACQRALGFRSAYVADVLVCGVGRDQANTIVEEILAGVEA
ncbi:MAG: sensor domain-containing protein [Mycobacterium sp.]